MTTDDITWLVADDAEAARPGILSETRARLGRRVQSTRYFDYCIEVSDDTDGNVSVALTGAGALMSTDRTKVFMDHMKAAHEAATAGGSYYACVLFREAWR